MASYFLDGPLTPNDNIIFTHRKDNVIYVLNTYTKDKSTLMFYDSGVVPAILAGGELPDSVPVFNASGSLKTLNFRTQGSLSGGLSYTSDNHIGLGATPGNISANQTTYNNWNPPTLFLAGVSYTLTTAAGKPLLIPVGSRTTAGQDPTFTDTVSVVVFLPRHWIFNCSASGSSATANSTFQGSLCSLFCSSFPDSKDCKGESFCAGVEKRGWTTHQGCDHDITYNYCNAGQYCSANCNGPCKDNLNACNYNTSKASWGCSFDPTSSWWKSPWFIVAVVGFVVLVIALIIIIIIATRKK